MTMTDAPVTEPGESPLAGLLCHCDADPAGHPLGEVDGCGTPPVRPGRYSRDSIPTAEGKRSGARGTCPACGRGGVKVTAPMRLGSAGPGLPHRVPLGRELTLAAHSTPGRGGAPCEGAGRGPAETRFTPSPDIAAWRAQHGPDSVR